MLRNKDAAFSEYVQSSFLTPDRGPCPTHLELEGKGLMLCRKSPLVRTEEPLSFSGEKLNIPYRGKKFRFSPGEFPLP